MVAGSYFLTTNRSSSGAADRLGEATKIGHQCVEIHDTGVLHRQAREHGESVLAPGQKIAGGDGIGAPILHPPSVVETDLPHPVSFRPSAGPR